MKGSIPPANLGLFGCPSFSSLWLWLFALESGKKNTPGWKISSLKGKVGVNPGGTWQKDPAKVVPSTGIFALCFGEPLCSSASARSGSASVRDDVNTTTCDFLWVFPGLFVFFSSGAVDISEVDTAVVLHPVGMAVHQPTPLPWVAQRL